MDIMLQRILELLGDKHGSGQDLVRTIGCRKNAVTDWKAGRSKSYTKYAPQIADYYGVSLDWLCGLTDEKTKKAPSEDGAVSEAKHELQSRIKGLNEEDTEKLLAFMNLWGM